MRIIHQDRKTGEIKLMPENLDDLWHLDKIIEDGDILEARSYRVYKPTEDSKGERKPITVKIKGEKIEFSKYGNSLRVTGKIVNGSPEEFVQIGSYHTINVEIENPLKIIKEKWQKYQIDRLQKAVSETKRPKLGIILLDNEKALVSYLKGYGVEHSHEIYSGRSKRDKNPEEKLNQFYAELMKQIEHIDAEKIIIAGPGFAKEELKEHIQQKYPNLLKKLIFEKASSAERSAIKELMTSGAISQAIGEHQIEKESLLVEKLKEHLGKGTGLAIYGFKEIETALECKAVSQVLVIDDLIRQKPEIKQILEKAEQNKVEIEIFSSESDPGHELKGFGGFAAFLYYKI
ncbi:mRNA surveillance protein pelota [Candidatus Micrarchaeota archaeon]|jgi:protein pelota|nr:mRNA surveillance protein pelota [Candidatus Micrarchaeota archaeon]